MKTKTVCWSAVCLLGLVAGEAQAQEQRVLVDSPIPFLYNRGRNVAVTDRDKPELKALGLNLGAFQLYPRLQLATGVTDNVFQQTNDKKSSAVFVVEPGILARSSWSRHSLSLTASAPFRRYGSASQRNENGWNAGAQGRFDIGSQSSVNVDLSTAQLYESNFSGAALSNFASPREYQRSFAAVRGNYVTGQFRIVGALDYNKYDFKPVELFDGTRQSQEDRDREVTRFTGQVEYGISPDTSLFVQLGYADSSYKNPIVALGANRDSKSVRVLGGASFDLTSFIRGSVGVGYASYRYQAPIFPDLQGVSVEAQLEYFPSQITTVELKLRRLIEDSTRVGSSGYFNSGARLTVDHELLRQLVLTGWVDYEVDTYRGIDTRAKIFQLGAGARYAFNRNAALRLEVTRGDRTISGSAIGTPFDETRGMLTLQLQL
jgi:hypothetical protein